MSDQLFRAIRTVQSRIANSPKAFQLEQQTVNSLINPILNALGWHTYDHFRVRTPYPIDNGSVDIALMHENQPVVLIEAKPLGKRFSEKEERQLRRYCNDEETQTGILTNGAEWHVYRPIQKGLDIQQRKILSIVLGEDDKTAQNAAELLSLFAYESISELNTKLIPILMKRYWQEIGNKELLEEYTNTFRKYFGKWVGLRTRDVSKSDAENLLREMIGLEQQPLPSPQPLPRPIPERRIKPRESGRAVVLAGEHFPVKYAKDILIQTAEWLVKKNHIGANECPIRIGKNATRNLIHTEPRHQEREFFSAYYLRNGLILETHGSLIQIKLTARRLLERYDYPDSTLQLIGFDD